MKNLNRRDLCVALSALAALGNVPASLTAEAQANPTPASGPDGKLSKSTVFGYSQLPVQHHANGGAARPVVAGTLPTGEFIEVHQTTLPAGQMPHPPHHHRHSELLLIRSGQLEYLNDGVPQSAGPGDVIFTASNVPHGLKNTGTTDASYFVVAIGTQTKES